MIKILSDSVLFMLYVGYAVWFFVDPNDVYHDETLRGVVIANTVITLNLLSTRILSDVKELVE